MVVIEKEAGLWLLEKSWQIIDVRSPIEFKQGHIPGAYNLPLFNDQERHDIGLVYKKNGPKEAMLLGLQYVGPKLRYFVEEVSQLKKDKSFLVHCWRGGKRSKSMAWLVANAGFEINLLHGGYKAYRQMQMDFYMENTFKIIILGGRTGTAKTQLLHALEKQGEQIIDMEALAHHKGSAFGGIGEPEQETNEQFENNLFSTIAGLDYERWIWIENESRTIGRNYIPELFWKHIKAASLINVERDLLFRINHLMSLYQKEDDRALISSFEKIRKRLGHEAAQNAIDFITDHNYEAAAQIALNYYDKCYDYNLETNGSPKIIKMQFADQANEAVIDALLNYKRKYFGT